MSEVFKNNPELSCGAAQLVAAVDKQLNTAARLEFTNATSALQESGADLGEGGACLDESTVKFNAQSVWCGLCKSYAHLLEEGNVTSPGCLTSGFCEKLWIEEFPHEYYTSSSKSTAYELRCRAPEIDCAARLAIALTADGKPTAVVTKGGCQVDERGENWRERCDMAIAIAPIVRPGADIPEFDGEGSGRES